MTDNDIIKALECCRVGKRKHDCKKCPLYCRVPACMGHLTADALDLINRQKAEIERLQHFRAELSKVIDRLKQDHALKIGEVQREQHTKGRNDGIQEIAEKMKERSDFCYLGDIESLAYRITAKDLENLVKEMTEEQE